MSPTARTLQECRRRGWQAGVVERWIQNPNHPGGGHRVDLFGFGDVVAIAERDDQAPHMLLIQATSGTNVAARAKKIRDECCDVALQLLTARCWIEVWGWKKYAKPVDRKYWRVRILEIDADFLKGRQDARDITQGR